MKTCVCACEDMLRSMVSVLTPALGVRTFWSRSFCNKKNPKNSCVLPLHISSELRYMWQGSLRRCVAPLAREGRLSGYRVEHQSQIASLENRPARGYRSSVLRDSDRVWSGLHLKAAPGTATPEPFADFGSCSP